MGFSFTFQNTIIKLSYDKNNNVEIDYLFQLKILIGAIVFAILSILFIDYPLTKLLNFYLSPIVREIATELTKMGSFTYIIIFNVLVILYYHYKRKKEKEGLRYIDIPFKTDTLYIAWKTVPVQIASTLIIKLLKHFFGRARPYYVIQNKLPQTFFFFQSKQDFLSFPSGHTAGIWGFIFCMFFIFKDNKYVMNFLYAIGIIVAVTRLILNSHFLSDVVIGGLISALICYNLMQLIDMIKIEIVEKK